MFSAQQQHLQVGSGETRMAIHRSKRWYDATETALGYTLVRAEKIFSYNSFKLTNNYCNLVILKVASRKLLIYSHWEQKLFDIKCCRGNRF